jgi:hypothetical protein
MTSATTQATAATIVPTVPTSSMIPPVMRFAVLIPSGFRYARKPVGFGSNIEPTASHTNAATVSRAAHRHRGDGRRPSGNNRRINVKTSTHPGAHSQVPDHATHWPDAGGD